MTPHPDSIKLLNYLAGVGELEMMQRHLDSCPECRRRVELFEQERTAMMEMVDIEARMDALDVISAPREPVHLVVRRLMPIFGVFAMITLVIGLFMADPFRMFNAPDHGLRTKGMISVDIFRKNGAQGELVHKDILFHADDNIRLMVTTPTAGYLTVVTKDGDRMLPVADLSNFPIMAMNTTPLPGSLILECDETVEVLHIYLSSEKLTGVPTTPVIGHNGLLGIKTLTFRCE